MSQQAMKITGAATDRDNAPQVRSDVGEKTATAATAKVTRPKSERLMAAKASQNRDIAATQVLASEKREDKPLHPNDEPCSSQHGRKASLSKHEQVSTSSRCSALERRVNEERAEEHNAASDKGIRESHNPNKEPGSSLGPSKATSSKHGRSSVSSKRSALERLVREQALQVKLLMAEKEKMMAEKEKTMAEAVLKCKFAALELQHETQRNNLEEVDGGSEYSAGIIQGLVLSGQDENEQESILRAKTAEWVQAQSKIFLPQACSSVEPVQQEVTRDKEVAALDWKPSDHIAARQVWPKKLPTFSGKPREWPKFYNCYVESTKACGLSPTENMARLEECLSGPARDAVEGWLDSPTSVEMVMKTLQRLYGRPSLVVKDLLEKVRRTPAPRPEHLDELITFGLTVLHLCNHLANADLVHYLSNPELLEEMVEKLPVTRKLEWVRFSESYHLPTLKEFGVFMDKLVEEACVVTRYTPPKPHTHRTVHRSNVHSLSHESPTPVVESNTTPCRMCKNTSHKLRQCEAFRHMSPPDRLVAVNQMKLCRNCLANHGTNPCKSRYSCGVPGCGQRHHSLLHQPREGATAQPAQLQTHHHVAKTTLFRVVPVTIHNGDKQIDTHAFLDEGSSLTLVEASLAASLGIEGESEPLELNWTANVKRREDSSQRISMEISARGGERAGLFNSGRSYSETAKSSKTTG